MHYLKLEVHQDYTEFAFMSIVYFEQNYIIEVQEHIASEIVNFLIFVTFQIKDFEGHYFKPVVLQGYTQLFLMIIVYFKENYIIEVREHITI